MIDRNLCSRCGVKINVNDYYYDDEGFGYSTKLCRCPGCGQVNILGYELDIHHAISVNDDPRYYDDEDYSLIEIINTSFDVDEEEYTLEDEGSTN